MAVVETRALARHYGDLHAVDGVDLDIEEGEVFGLLGPNGAGKTTLLSMLVPLVKPTSGTAHVAGFEVAREPLRVRKQVGIVFQEPSLDTILTGRENLDLHGMLYGVPSAERPGRVKELLQLVDLEGRADDLVKTYSGGMKRRLEIARGLMHKPRLLFLDEPTLGLDPQTREHIWAYIEGLVERQGTTVVLTTHYMEEADRLCDRIAIIDRGRIIALDTPEALKAGLGGDRVILEVPAGAREALSALPFVEHLETSGSEIHLSVRDASRHLPAILAAAPGVARVEVRTPTLSDVFLRFTGRAMRAESTEEAGSGFLGAYSATQRGS